MNTENTALVQTICTVFLFILTALTALRLQIKTHVLLYDNAFVLLAF